MSNNFCRYLTNGLRIQSWYGQLVASPCCYLPGIPINSNEFNTTMDKYRELRSCSACLSYVGGDITNPNYPPLQSKNMIKDVAHNDPVYVELSIDNKCNAACLSCTDSFSSYWAEQNKKFNIKTVDDYPDAQNDQEVVDELFNKFNFENCSKLNFLGGEPLISKTTTLVLEKLINLNIAKNISLLFTTNGSTKFTDRQITLLKHFKMVRVSYSVDDINDRFYYLRYPLKWNKLLTVIDSVRSNEQLNNIEYYINITVGALNAFYVDEIFSWTREYFHNDSKFMGIHTPACNGVMSPHTLPYKAKQYLQEKYKDTPRLSNIFRNNTNSHDIKQLIDYLHTWDQRRGTNWQETFPLAVPFLTNV